MQKSDKMLCGYVITLTLIALGLLGCGRQTAGKKPAAYERSWESLQHYRCPDWFRDAKFGIYAHWGPYCVPAFPTTTDWYSHHMYQPDHPIHQYQVETYGPVSRFGYKDLVKQFTAPRFDAEEWAALYQRAGARFAGPVAEHSDGFAMWDSQITEWDSFDKGPHRDVVAEMAKAIRARGLKFLTSFHHHWKWGWYATPIKEADCRDRRYEGLYGPVLPESAWGRKLANGRIDYMDVSPLPDRKFNTEWLGKIKEVIDGYHPDLIWFDNRMHIIEEPYRIDMAAYYYNQAARRDQEVVLTYKQQDLAEGAGVLDLERNRMPDIYAEPWLTDTSIAKNSWSYCPKLDYYSTERLIRDLVDIVSKNGCMLLNIAPHPDGSIPAPQQERLEAMGGWLRENGEAIYGSRPWRIFGEGPTETPKGHLSDLGFKGFTGEDIRFTQAQDGSALYLILMGWPKGDTVRVRSLGRDQGTVKTVRYLAYDSPIQWHQSETELTLTLGVRPPAKYAIVLKLTGDHLTRRQ